MPFENGMLGNNVIGYDIDVRYMEIRYYIYKNSTLATNLGEPLYVRFTLVKTPLWWTLGSPTLPFIPDSNIPVDTQIGGGGTQQLTYKWNSNVVKVLQQKTVVLRPSFNGTSNFKYGRVRFRKLKGKKTFMVQNSTDVEIAQGRIRQGQYYIVIEMDQSLNASASNNAGMYYDYSVYYKDM